MRLVLLATMGLDKSFIELASLFEPGLDLKLLEAKDEVAHQTGVRVANETLHVVFCHDEVLWVLLL